MNWFDAALKIISSVLDMLPSRREKILNKILEIKDELKKMQQRASAWTVADSGRYYQLTDQLRQLEARAQNFGK